jgi:hypothetical protein
MKKLLKKMIAIVATSAMMISSMGIGTSLQAAAEETVFYSVSLGDAQGSIDDEEFCVPVSFDGLYDDTYGALSLTINLYYDMDALELVDVATERKTLGHDIINLYDFGNEPDAEGVMTTCVATTFSELLTKDTEPDQLYLLYFEPKNIKDNTKYEIKAVAETVTKWLTSTTPVNSAGKGVVKANAGSITVGTPAEETLGSGTVDSAPTQTVEKEITLGTDMITCYVVGGTRDGASVTRANSEDNTSNASDIYYLNEIQASDTSSLSPLIIDGNATTTATYGASRVVFIDIGDADVSKVEIYNVAGNYCFATGDVTGFETGSAPTSITKGTPVKYTANAAIRLNNDKEGYNISKSNAVHSDGVVTISGIDFGRYLILDLNNSNGAVGEIKVYGAATELAQYDLTIGGAAYKASYNDKVTLTASAKQSGKVFSHWTKDGQIVSYDKEYTFFATADATVEAVYAASAPEAKACYTVNYAVVDDEIEFVMECTFPEGVTDGTMTLTPYKTKADGTVKNSGKFTAEGLSGTAQYKFSFKGIDNFNADNYLKLGLAFGGTYESNAVAIDISFKESSESGVYVLEGFPDVEAGVVGKTF